MIKVGLIDYDAGNLGSLEFIIKAMGYDVISSKYPHDLIKCDKLILPGVGSFYSASETLFSRGWDKLIHFHVEERKSSLLGICLGMQLLADEGVEGNNLEAVKGLSLISGKVVRMNRLQDYRIPHVGWNEVSILNQNNGLFKDVEDNTDFYFAHSYHFIPNRASDIAGYTKHGINFVSAVAKNSIYGVQFHPEKSLSYGKAVIRNFLELD